MFKKEKNETIVGILVFITILLVIYATFDLEFLIYFIIMFIFASIAIRLYTKKSLLAKTGAILIYNDLLFKLLMPRKYKKEITKLEEKEGHEKT